MNLNLGSNNIKYKNFLNVDIRNIPEVDIVDDVTKLETIKDDSIDAIIAHNILEHISYDKTDACLNNWAKKLKRGGWIEIGVPDGELIFKRYQKGIVTRKEYNDSSWKDVIHSIFGNMKIVREMHGNDAEKYMHHNIFCESFLRECMEKAGFKKIIKVKQNHPDNITLRGYKA